MHDEIKQKFEEKLTLVFKERFPEKTFSFPKETSSCKRCVVCDGVKLKTSMSLELEYDMIHNHLEEGSKMMMSLFIETVANELRGIETSNSSIKKVIRYDDVGKPYIDFEFETNEKEKQ